VLWSSPAKAGDPVNTTDSDLSDSVEFTAGVDGPRRHQCARMRSLQISNEGAVHERSYPHWHRHVQECFRAARRRRGGTAGAAPEAAAPADARVFRPTAAGADRRRGLWGGALLGA